MLERTAGCLESGSLRRLLPTSRKSLKSRRTLHSGFWTHGASSIELSPLWAVLVRAADHINQNEPSDLPQQTASGTFLEFLYPVGTLNFLRQYSGWVADRNDKKRRRSSFNKLGHRSYSSKSQDPMPLEETAAINVVENHHPSAISRIEDESEFPEASSQDSAVAASIPIEDKPVSVRRVAGVANPGKIKITDYHNTSAIFDQLGVTKDIDYEEAWRKYTSKRGDERILIQKPLLGYMSTSGRRLDAVRSLQLFEEIIEQNRDYLAYRYAIRAHLRVENLSAATELYEKALHSIRVPAGSEELISYYIKHSDWQRAHNIWSDAQEPETFDINIHRQIYESLDLVPDLQKLAIKLSAYAQKNAGRLRTSTEAPNLTGWRKNGKTLRSLSAWDTFVSEIIMRALLQPENFSDESFSKLWSALRKWGTDTEDFYERCIGMLIGIRRPRWVLNCYAHLRHHKKGWRLSMNTLQKILKIMCDKYIVNGIQQVLDDFFRLYEKPTRTAYQICLGTFASHGDAETVHAIFGQYVQRYTPEIDHTTPSGDVYKETVCYLTAMDFEPVLHVHAIRGELDLTLKYFKEMEERYNVTPTIRNWNILINAYGKADDVDGAYECFERILSSKQKPDDYTIGTLMGISTLRGDIDRVLELYKLAEELGVRRTAAMVDCLVQSHVQEQELVQAEKICEDALNMSLDASRGRMWNLLLIAHAQRGDMININRLLRRMTEINVEYDEFTYSALMHALSVLGTPDQAYKILKNVLPAVGIRPSQYHYATVMGGYLQNREPHKVFQLNEHLLRNGIPSSASINLMGLKAASRRSRVLLNDTQEQMEQRAMQMYEQLILADSQEISINQKKGFSKLPLDIAYQTMIHSYTMTVMSRHSDTVETLFARFKKIIPESRQTETPPIQILGALMLAKYMASDYKAVEDYWSIAFLSAKKHGSPIPHRISVSDEDVSPYTAVTNAESLKEILPVHQLDLSKALSTYMRALHDQGRTDRLIEVIQEVTREGFELDSRNWNLYIRLLVRGEKHTLAFALCEDILMKNFSGWKELRRQQGTRNRLPIEYRLARRQPRYLRPYRSTMAYLARAYVEIEVAANESKKSRDLFVSLKKNNPKLVRAIKTMSSSNEEFERSILSGQRK